MEYQPRLVQPAIPYPVTHCSTPRVRSEALIDIWVVRCAASFYRPTRQLVHRNMGTTAHGYASTLRDISGNLSDVVASTEPYDRRPHHSGRSIELDLLHGSEELKLPGMVEQPKKVYDAARSLLVHLLPIKTPTLLSGEQPHPGAGTSPRQSQDRGELAVGLWLSMVVVVRDCSCDAQCSQLPVSPFPHWLISQNNSAAQNDSNISALKAQFATGATSPAGSCLLFCRLRL